MQRNPRLIYGRMTGWGQTGPLAHSAGHDINYIAMTGALAAMGRTGEPAQPPLNLVGDFGGGSMFLAFRYRCGLVGAGKVRERTGHRCVDRRWRRVADDLLCRPGPQWSDYPGARRRTSSAAQLLSIAAICARMARRSPMGAIEPKFYAELLSESRPTRAGSPIRTTQPRGARGARSSRPSSLRRRETSGARCSKAPMRVLHRS